MQKQASKFKYLPGKGKLPPLKSSKLHLNENIIHLFLHTHKPLLLVAAGILTWAINVLPEKAIIQQENSTATEIACLNTLLLLST